MRVPPRSRGSAAVRAERSFVARQMLLPVQAFFYTAQTSSLVLLAATVGALAWANSPWQESYSQLWATTITIDLDFLSLAKDLKTWIDDGLMAIFFFAVGLEVKHELVRGALSEPRRAALPVIAALGGMLVPAGLFISVNLGGEGFRGWGVPMATDIAFALGVLALLGKGIPPQLRTLLLALAVADDIGAILVIALFYTSHLSFTALGVALLLLGIILAMERFGLHHILFYIFAGVLFWLAVLESGVHATIAGVVLGLVTPAHPYFGMNTFADRLDGLVSHFREAFQRQDHDTTEVVLGQIEELTINTEAPVERLDRLVTPWANYVVLPLFALANAGVTIGGQVVQEAISSPVTLGVLLGLLVGKPVGVILFSWVAVRTGIASLPSQVAWRHIIGMGMLAGIGFTVSLFITGLAFDDATLTSEAKVGILVASVLSGLGGYALLRLLTREESQPAAEHT